MGDIFTYSFLQMLFVTRKKTVQFQAARITGPEYSAIREPKWLL